MNLASPFLSRETLEITTTVSYNLFLQCSGEPGGTGSGETLSQDAVSQQSSSI